MDTKNSKNLEMKLVRENINFERGLEPKEKNRKKDDG